MKRLVLAAAAVLGMAGSASAQTVVNGNFNTLGTGVVVGPGQTTDVFATWDEYIYTDGPETLAHCQANTNSPVRSNLDAPGDFSLVIRAEPTVGCRSGVEQTLTGLTFGQAYQFEFNARYIPGTTSGNNVAFVFAGDTLLSQAFSNTSQLNFFTGSFVATSTSGLFQIEGFTAADNSQVRIDDVVIDPVGSPSAIVTPEPATMAMMASGLVVLAGAGRRRRRRA